MKKLTQDELGSKAFEYISDYPLYASTSGITYEEGIAIANVLNPDWLEELESEE